MPYVPPSKTSNPAQAAAEKSAVEAAAAVKADKNPDSPDAKPAPENLVVVEGAEKEVKLDTRQNVRLSRARLEAMTEPELRVVVQQRGYLKPGDRHFAVGRRGTIEKILKLQDEDENLVDDTSHPAAVESLGKRVETATANKPGNSKPLAKTTEPKPQGGAAGSDPTATHQETKA